jgi:RNA polymerase sigma-70 factor, ECF subfamily
MQLSSTLMMAAGTALSGSPRVGIRRWDEQEPMTTALGEEEAGLEFANLLVAHRPQIFRFLLASMRDIDLAETLTQECFLKAHRNWSSFRGDSSVVTWLMRIAINLQKDHWRNRRIQFWRHTRSNAVDPDEASEWLPSGESSPEEQLLAREQVKRVWQAVEGLSERQRTVFLLRFVEDMEIAEIGRATGLSEGTVKAHLSRALGRVRNEVRGAR